MLLGAHFAGAAIENSMLGAAHAAANPLTANYSIEHGIAVSLMLPYVIKINEAVVSSKYRELTEAADLESDLEPGTAISVWLQELAAQSGLPTSLHELGIEESALPKLADEAVQQWTGQFNPQPMNEEDYLDLYKKAF